MASSLRAGASIRRYRGTDLAAVYDICVRTADGGRDARGKYLTDDLMPDLTPDTAAFARAYRERWIPRLAGRYPVPPEPAVSPDEHMLALHYSPERMIWPGLAEYPAHLHIDLLPGFQGAGYGRQLMDTFYAAAADAGAVGVHLVVVKDNAPALGFYRHLGYEPLDVVDPAVVYLGRKL